MVRARGLEPQGRAVMCLHITGAPANPNGQGPQQARSPYRISRRIGILMSKILLPIGELMLFLGLWIALWDIRNEFLLWLLGVGLLLLSVGLALE